MGQISPNKPFITTMADDLKQTEPPKKQTTPIPPIKPADNTLKSKLVDIPEIIPKKIIPAAPPIKKPIIPSFSIPPKPATMPRPIPPKPIVPSQPKPIIPPQPIIPPKPIAPLFSTPSKPNIIPQLKEKPITAKIPPVNIPKPGMPKQKISPNIPDKILIKPSITKPHSNKILIIATIAIIIISGVSGYYYWPTTELSTIEEEKPQNLIIGAIDEIIDTDMPGGEINTEISGPSLYVLMRGPQDSINYTLDLNIFQKERPDNTFTRYLLKYAEKDESQNTRYITFSEINIFTLSSTNNMEYIFPWDNFQDYIENTSFFIYSQRKSNKPIDSSMLPPWIWSNRPVLILKLQGEKEGLLSKLREWENTIPEYPPNILFTPIPMLNRFIDQETGEEEVPHPDTKTFNNDKYNNVKIRYINFGGEETSLNYAILEQQNILVVATSRESMRATLNTLLKSESVNIPKRKLIKLIDNNSIYYVTEVGTKRLIPSEEILNSYPLNKYAAIITVSQEEFDSYPENIFIKLPDDPKIYKLENGQKRWLENEDASKNPDFDWTQVSPVNQAEFDFYPESAPIE